MEYQSATPITDLIPYVNNARTHSDEQIAQVAASILEFGFTNPILIDEQSSIIAGHGRLAAARKLGMGSVPTIRLQGLSEAQKKAYVIADNSLALNAGWDVELLQVEIADLVEMDFDTDLLGFDDDFMSGLLDEEQEIDLDEEYSTKIDSLIYEPTEEKPAVSSLLDSKKAQELISAIDSSDCPEDIKAFLRSSAYRHNVFDYQKIADFYANSSAEVQSLMEDSALVHVDIESAIESGFVRVNQKISEMRERDYG